MKLFFFMTLVITTAWSLEHKVNGGLYHLQSKWGDELDGSLAQFSSRDTVDVQRNAPQTLSIWYLQYEVTLGAWSASLKGGYHSNSLHPYTILTESNASFNIDADSPNLDSHSGLEDFEINLGYRWKGWRYQLGTTLPLFQTSRNTLGGEVNAWDGFRSYRALNSLDGVWLSNWWMLRTDIIYATQDISFNRVGDGNVQLMQFYGNKLYKRLGYFAGNIIQYSWYHWEPQFESNEVIFRRDFLLEPQLGLSYETSYATLKAYVGATLWGSAEVRTLDDQATPEDTNPNRWRPAQSPRNLLLGFDLSTQF